jgi:hypothetical protein
MKITLANFSLTVVPLYVALSVSAQNPLPWSKIASGGGSSQSSSYRLGSTIGQWDAGRSSGSSLTLVSGFWGGSLAGSFTPGNLLVEGVGGPPGLQANAQPVWIEELTTNGVLQQAKYMPTNYPRPFASPFNLMDAGSETLDGYPTRSADGRLVCIPGYNATNQEANIAGSSTSAVLRVIGVLKTDGALDSSRAAGMFSGLNFYSVTSQDGSGFWGVGESTPGRASGLVYFQPGVATNMLTNALFRCVRIVNNQLYVSPQPGAGPPGGIYAVGTGLPTNGTQRLAQLFPLTGSPCQFEINPAMTIAYVADDGTLGHGGIKKYTNNGTAWSSNYTLTISGTGTVGARGLAVDWAGLQPIVYATTVESSANRLVRLVDTGAGASTVALQTAPAFTGFRGVTWTPVRLSMPAIISEQVLGNGSFQLTFTGTVTQPYRVLASSNVAAPLTTWATLATGMFGPAPVTFTDPAPANQPLRFYRIASP